MTPTRTTRALDRLLKIMAILRSPSGCPWDARQTPESLKSYLVEETYEVLDAIDRGNPSAIREELGDLLLHVVFLARIFEERGEFDLGDVAEAIADKLERRHPHVFASPRNRDSASLDAQWEAIKNREKEERGESTRVLAGVPRTFPALLRARTLSEKAARVGFDWQDVAGVKAKVREELEEFEEALAARDQKEMENELGDLLFAVVNLGRFLNIDAEVALGRTSDRFVARFEHIEEYLKSQGISFRQASLDKLESLWERAKVLEKDAPPETAKI